jgi:hypothetical protein
MKKAPIKKNLTDRDMLGVHAEESTFETDIFAEETLTPKPKPILKDAKSDFVTGFFSKELQEDVSKALLELKVKLYKEGIVDYNLKVTQKEHQVIISAAPVIKDDKPASRKEK